MVPLGLSLYVLRYFLARIMQQGFQVPNVWAVSAAALAMIAVLFILEKLKYGKTYNGAYEEAANVRISLAESLRKLPLSYFGRRDLSYLTSTLLNDVTLIEESLSHAVPELFGGIISILIAAALLAFLDWRMTIALFIFAFAGFFIIVAARSVLDKKAKQAFAQKDLIYDSLQQMIDNIKVLKSSDKKAAYVQKLKDDITESTYITLKAEAAGGAFIFGSAAIVRFGFPLVISYGAYLLSQGRIELLTYIVFLLVSCRIFDPLTTVFMMLGEFFLMLIAVERKQAIVNYPKQTGSESFKPNGYDIRYDNVSFSYNEPNGKDADSDTEENTVSGIDFTAEMIKKAKAYQKSLVLPEGDEERTIRAAAKIVAKNIAKKVILLGSREKIESAAQALKVSLAGIDIIDPVSSPWLDDFGQAYFELRQGKINKKTNLPEVGDAAAGKAFMLSDYLSFGAMMVRKGYADAMVSGARSSTAALLRAGLKVIGTESKTASSCFVMDMHDSSWGHKGLMIFSDCAVVPEPDAEQLSDIAVAAGKSCKALLGCDPCIALLSFSTKGSGGAQPSVLTVQEAVQKAHAKAPSLLLDGELQADAALIPSVTDKKAPAGPPTALPAAPVTTDENKTKGGALSA